MGAKICTPSEKLDDEGPPAMVQPLAPQEKQMDLLSSFQESDHDMGPDYDEEGEFMDAVELHLPDYDGPLPFQRLPLFEKSRWAYRQVMESSLVRTASLDLHSEAQLLDTRRALREAKILAKTLPCEESNAIFVAISQSNMAQMMAVVFGSEDTPYEHGAFVYSIQLGDNYPQEPPKVTLQTTGANTVRFNPNLYESGYVCLSLLGTWTGSPKENWQPGQSNISQVLLSIQTIVMNEDVYFNEPSYEDLDRGEYRQYNSAYQDIVRFGNIAHAMNEMIESPPEVFREIILTHFYLKRNRILESVARWIEQERDSSFEELVQQHNYNFCLRYGENPWMHKNDLVREYQRLHKNLGSIDFRQTLMGKEETQKQGAEVEKTAEGSQNREEELEQGQEAERTEQSEVENDHSSGAPLSSLQNI